MLDLLAAISSVDPPSFVAWLVLAFAGAMYPLGLMLGSACSACCAGPCKCGYFNRGYEGQTTRPSEFEGDQYGRFCCSGEQPEEITISMTLAGVFQTNFSLTDSAAPPTTTTVSGQFSVNGYSGDYVLQKLFKLEFENSPYVHRKCAYLFTNTPLIEVGPTQTNTRVCKSAGIRTLELTPENGSPLPWPQWNAEARLDICVPFSAEVSYDGPSSSSFQSFFGEFPPLDSITRTSSSVKIAGFRRILLGGRWPYNGSQNVPPDFDITTNPTEPYDYTPIYTEQNCAMVGVKVGRNSINRGEVTSTWIALDTLVTRAGNYTKSGTSFWIEVI